MKSNLFYKEYGDNSYLFEHDYIEFYLYELLFERDDCSIPVILEFFNNKYGENYKKTQLISLIKENFHYKKYISSLYDEQVDLIIRTNFLNNEYLSNFLLDVNTAKESLIKSIKQNNYNFEETIALYYSIISKTKSIDDEYFKYQIFNFLKNKDEIDMFYDNILNIINDQNYSLLIKDVIDNDELTSLLNELDVITIKDLINLDSELLKIFFSLEYKEYMYLFKSLEMNSIQTMKENINEMLTLFNEREILVLTKRNGILGEDKLTLEEIGSVYGITRERIRQIEAKTYRIIKEQFDKYKNNFYVFMKYIFKSESYLSLEEFNTLVNDSFVSDYIRIIISICDTEYIYDEKLNLIYDYTTLSLDDILSDVYAKYAKILTFEMYDKANSFEKEAILRKYKIYKGKLYILNEMNSKDLIGTIIDELFPDGYHIGQSNDYDILRNEVINRYGIDFDYDRSIAGFLERLNYCLIDRGVYKNRDYCVKLPEEFISEILNYISSNSPTVFYASIYEKFKSQFISFGVNNYWYLKGLIDYELPEEFKTKRDYIITSSEQISSFDSILNYMKSFEHSFSLQNIKDKYIGVKEYVIFNVIYNQIENGLLRLDNQEFIYFDKLNVNESEIEYLRNVIINTFDQLDVSSLSIRKIYAKIMMNNKQFFINHEEITSPFSLYSLLYILFKDEFYFCRPMVSKDKDSYLTEEMMLVNYLKQYDSFDILQIRNYILKMNFNNIMNYTVFFESLSDDYVQISREKMVRKNKLILSDIQLKEIDKLLKLILERQKEISTKTFNLYYMFPKTNFLWNKYMLIGIIRSYFSDKFTIENTESDYRITDYIIRGL